MLILSNRMTKGSVLVKKASTTLDSELSIETGDVQPVRRVSTIVQATLVTSNYQPPSSILVCAQSNVILGRRTNIVIGFLTKIKKLLETVCHNCGKIKANTVSHPFWDGKSLTWHFMLTYFSINPV